MARSPCCCPPARSSRAPLLFPRGHARPLIRARRGGGARSREQRLWVSRDRGVGVGARGWGTPTCHGPAARRVGSSAQVCFLGGWTARDPEGPRPGQGRGRQRPLPTPARASARHLGNRPAPILGPRELLSQVVGCVRLVAVVAPARHVKPAKVSWITRSTPARVRVNHRKREDVSPARALSTPRRLVPRPPARLCCPKLQRSSLPRGDRSLLISR